MGTEVAISFSALRTQLENEKSNLYKLDENIKKIVQTSGRYNDRFNNASNEYGRNAGRLGGRNSYPDQSNNYKNDELFGKRKHETKTVFSRLSARCDSPPEGEGEGVDGGGTKRARIASAVWREPPSRAAALRAQAPDEQARTRNRRIFGALLGTLQKFKQEEIILQTKELKKAEVERKIEEQARQEKEREQQERKTLFAERESKKATIKALEAKMARVQEFEKWEVSQKSLSNFILTRAKPHVYWLPKKMTDKATEKLNSSRKYHERCLVKKRQELQDELKRIEQRCLRTRGPGAKENYPDANHDKSIDASDNNTTSEPMDHEDGTAIVKKEKDDKSGKKRDKFAMDVDEKEKDSDVEDQHDETSTDVTVKQEKDKESKKTASPSKENVKEVSQDEPEESEESTAPNESENAKSDDHS